MPIPIPIGQVAFYGVVIASFMPAVSFIGCAAATWLPKRSETNEGERLARAAFDTAEVERLDDFLLERPDGSLVQIDHAVKFPGGIMVVETKHWRGRFVAPIDAFGGPWYVEHDDDMLVPAFDGANPFLQNESHVDAVRDVTDERVPVWNVVLMSYDDGWVRFAEAENDEEQAFADDIRERNGYILPLDDFPGLWDLEDVPSLCSAMAARPAAPGVDKAWAALKAAARTDRRTRRRHESQVGSDDGASAPSRLWASLLLLTSGLVCGAAALAFWGFQAGVLLPVL